MAKDIETIILNDIREMAQRIVLDEKRIKEEFLRHNAELADKAIKTARKELQTKQKRLGKNYNVIKLYHISYKTA